jgi:DNA-binding response OmpR family regulator
MFKVLVVDDDPNVRLFLERLLRKKFSCTVETAKNGADALSKLNDFDAEVMLLDITMPVMDGVETLTALRNDDKLKDLAVIVLTAVSEKETVAKVMQMGVIDYMLKPLLYEHTYTRLKELFDIIRKRIQKKKLLETSEWENENSSSNNAEKFLLIFGEDDIRKNFHTKLSEIGFEVYSTDNGADGLKLFMKYKPQHVIVGENIPLLNENLLAQKMKLYSKNNENLEIVAIKSSLDNITDLEKKNFDLILAQDKSFKFFSKFNIPPKN